MERLFEGVLYINDMNKQPLQVVLSDIVASFSESMSGISGSGFTMLGVNVQSAAVMVAMVPLILLYPFLQKYLIKGAMVGAIKE